MKYELKYADRNLKVHTREYSGTYDGARKAACILFINKRSKHTVHIHRSGYRWAIGELWFDGRDFCYLSLRAGEGIIWKVNPRTGKLTSKLGYED